MAERPVSTLNKPDAALELTLRPSLFSEFTGQPKVKERLGIGVAAAPQRGEGLDNKLLRGPPRRRAGGRGQGGRAPPPHPPRVELARLLLDRGAHPYDGQVIYNIHFHEKI